MSRLPVRTKIIFGSADLFGGGALNLVGFYYMIFLTDVMQIRPAVADCAKFCPEMVRTERPWRQSLDTACFI